MAKERVAARDTKVHFAPSARIFTNWTPERLRAAELTAENGDLSLAVQVCEWMLTDDRVSGVLATRANALLGLEPSFELGVGRRKRQAAKALEADEDWFEAYPESELRQMLIWGLLLGVSLSRHNWTERADHGGRMLPMPSFWHPQTLKWSWPLRRWTVRDSLSAELIVTPGDSEWILHTPFGNQRPWAHGMWRSLSRWALLKQFAMGDWARHSGKGAKTIAMAPEGATVEQRRELAEDIQNSGTDPVIALPNGFTVDLLEISANTKAIYEAQIAAADMAFAVRVRGGNLTTQVDKGGSRAATETQAESGDGANMQADAAGLATTLNQQSLPWWAEFNFGDKRLAPWPVWPVEPEEDKSQRATMVSMLADGLTKMKALGFQIDGKKVVDEFGVDFLGELKEAPQPVAAPATGAPDSADASGTDKTPDAAVKGPKVDIKARATTPVAKAETGHLDGQLYVDDVIDDARARGSKELRAGLIKRLLDAVGNASGYEEIRAVVLEKYKGAASPEQLRELTRCALVMSDLAGTLSVVQDS